MASQDRPFLSDEIAATIIELCVLMKEALSVPAGAMWIKMKLAEATETKAARTNSSLSGHSVYRAY